MVVLDERGTARSSLAPVAAGWVNGCRRGATWFSSLVVPMASHRKCVQRANERWSLSPLTLPHALVRVVLAEQLYRAVTLLDGHPYHRE